MPATMQEIQKQHHEAVDHNRALGVTEYKSGEKQVDAVYEVTDGYKHLPGGIRLGPGGRFRPTERQVKNGALRNKARELSGSEYRDIRASGSSVAGADIGLRALPMAEGTVEIALEAGLTEGDFAGIEPEGANSRYTRAQVERMIETRNGG
jgi:hypothetical protein